ncbi:TonB-dependent siderophore receptor (plasmid) [Gloeothece citriformis PCC 7424]|uniref:TonB-dependent siderophore receptor n=1 Tax=Gloeothece citriformis (strain PCC 7424) TaxID=65393 RepID=B7KM01_GLOC7|nr:TonB-dependent siderophore receptor [Gloeothece citriformis]ACK73823.1 TonB-dependent siderophore receptor [Gloeothece citriformis PCC 7424]
MKIPSILPTLLFATGAVLSFSQPAQAQTLIQVTGIQLEPTPNGLKVIVETAQGNTPQAFIIPSGETVDIQLLDSQLNLPDKQSFQVENPVDGIASVTVTQGEANTVQVTIVGTQGSPQVELVPSPLGVVLDLRPSSTTVTPEEPTEEIDIIATTEANENDYIVEDATTATFTDTPLRDIPQSIQVIPEQIIEDQQVIRLDEALRNVSGVVQGNTFGGTQDEFIIRGFTSTSGNLLLDGFRLPNSGTTFRETATLERIEVLKGPAGVLFGFVEPGGVINLITKKPLPEPYYDAQLQIGSFAFFRPTFDLSGPLTEDKSLLYRLMFGYETEDGFREFDQGVNRFYITPVVSWKPSDQTEILFDLSFIDDERPFDRGIINNVNFNIPEVPVNRIFGEPDDKSEVEEFSIGYRLNHEFNENWEIQNNFRYISSFNFNYRAEPLYDADEFGNLSRNFRSNDAYEENFNLQTRLIGKVATGPVDHTLLFGFDAFRETFWQQQNRLPVGLTPSINLFDPQYNVIPRPFLSELTTRLFFFRNRTDYVGLYLQDQVTITDNLKLLLNGRVDIATQENKSRETGEETVNGDSDFTPRVGIVYQPIEPVSLYASYSESFVPNGSTRADGTFLPPEEGRQYEIGIRTELNEGRVVLNLAAYDITKSNVATDDPLNPGFSIPTGEIRSQGIEFDVIGRILPGWNIIASYAYTDARITEDNDPERVGLRVGYVPYSAASLWTTYTIQSGNLEGLGFGAGFFYIGDRIDGFIPSVFLSSYTRVDAAIYYRRKNWQAEVNFKNLFNDYYIESGFYEPGAPFNVIGSFSIQF